MKRDKPHVVGVTVFCALLVGLFTLGFGQSLGKALLYSVILTTGATAYSHVRRR